MRMSIADIQEKIKRLHPDTLQQIFMIGIIVVVAISSFALGRFSVAEEGREVEVLYPEQVVERAQMSLDEDNVVVASTRGSKYHYPWCPGAISMSEANKIEFEDIEEAREAGYTPASNCEGLE